MASPDFKQTYRQDYVYHPETAPEEIHNIHITIAADKVSDKLLINLDTDIEMSPKDVNDVLKSLTTGLLKRHRINVVEDCRVTINVEGGKCFEATICEDPSIIVKGLVPV